MNRIMLGLITIALVLAVAGQTLQAAELAPDEVMVHYPVGYTHLLMADLGSLLGDQALSQGLIDPLQRARQPLGEIISTLSLLRIDPQTVGVAAMGEGPGLTSFAYVEGPGAQTVLPALQGLQGAVGAPGSPFTNWKQERIGGLPVVFTGGLFGPVKIQWAFIVEPQAFWIGTEVAFSGEPDVARLRASTQKIIARYLGQVKPMAELLTARDLRGGQIAFIRVSDPTRDKPLFAGEAVMGFSARITEKSIKVKFQLRFNTPAQAQAALEQLQAGRSSYLSAQLYRAKLARVLYGGRTPGFQVQTDVTGLVGLLLLTMPF